MSSRSDPWGRRRAFDPYSTGTYVNVMAERDAEVSRGYHAEQLRCLAELKRKYDRTTCST